MAAALVQVSARVVHNFFAKAGLAAAHWRDGHVVVGASLAKCLKPYQQVLLTVAGVAAGVGSVLALAAFRGPQVAVAEEDSWGTAGEGAQGVVGVDCSAHSRRVLKPCGKAGAGALAPKVIRGASGRDVAAHRHNALRLYVLRERVLEVVGGYYATAGGSRERNHPAAPHPLPLLLKSRNKIAFLEDREEVERVAQSRKANTYFSTPPV
jgi:hypothetical protein